MSVKKISRGAMRSKVVWLGLAVLVMGELQRGGAIVALIPEVWRGVVLECLGLGIIVARFLTTGSLLQKGTTDETENS